MDCDAEPVDDGVADAETRDEGEVIAVGVLRVVGGAEALGGAADGVTGLLGRGALDSVCERVDAGDVDGALLGAAERLGDADADGNWESDAVGSAATAQSDTRSNARMAALLQINACYVA